MTKFFHFTKKTFLVYFIFAIAVFAANFFVQFYWLKFLGFLLNRPLAYDQQSAILRYTKSLFTYFPLYVLGIIFVIDIFRKNFSKSVSFFLGLASVYILMMGNLFFWPSSSDYFKRMKFDPAIWKSEEITVRKFRIRMVNDLLKWYRLEGMSRKQIDDLLGVPKPAPWYKDYDYVYYLGFRTRETDGDCLGIKFENDVVVKAAIW